MHVNWSTFCSVQKMKGYSKIFFNWKKVVKIGKLKIVRNKFHRRHWGKTDTEHLN